MTQSNILELAKQGNQEAIASVVNYLLKDKGITAKAVRRNDCLVVVLESRSSARANIISCIDPQTDDAVKRRIN